MFSDSAPTSMNWWQDLDLGSEVKELWGEETAINMWGMGRDPDDPDGTEMS